LAASILYLALKLGHFTGLKQEVEEINKIIADFSGLDTAKVRESAITLFTLVKNFDRDFSNLKNLRIVYCDELKTLRSNPAFTTST
jgi:hypothetical protein